MKAVEQAPHIKAQRQCSHRSQTFFCVGLCELEIEDTRSCRLWLAVLLNPFHANELGSCMSHPCEFGLVIARLALWRQETSCCWRPVSPTPESRKPGFDVLLLRIGSRARGDADHRPTVRLQDLRWQRGIRSRMPVISFSWRVQHRRDRSTSTCTTLVPTTVVAPGRAASGPALLRCLTCSWKGSGRH